MSELIVGIRCWAGKAAFGKLNMFFTGLLLVPIGVYLSKRQIQKGLIKETFDRKAALHRLL